MTTAAIYARASSAEQRKDGTVRTQLEVLRNLAVARGLPVIEEFVDDGFTAKSGHLEARNGLTRLFAAAKARRFDVLLVIDVDRLTRAGDMGERNEVLAVFQRAGVPIVTPSATYDLRSSTGDLMALLAGWKAADDNRLRAERTRDGQLAAIRRGEKPRGPTPIGLRWDRDAKSWSIDPVRSEVVREIFARVAAGEFCARIASDFDARGIKRPRAGRWTTERIRRIVRSDTYLGRFVVDQPRGLSLPVPPIVDPDLAATARAVLSSRFRRPSPRVKHYHLLSGLAVCGWCQAVIGMGDTTVRGDGDLEYVRAYRCMYRRRPPVGQPRCELPVLRVEGTDRRVWEAFVDAINNPRTVDRVLAKLAAGGARPDPQAHRGELARLDRAMDSLLAQLAAGHIPQAVSDAQIARLGAKRRAAELALADALLACSGLRAATGADAVAEIVDGFRRNAPNASPEQRRALLHAATVRAVIDRDVVALDLGFDADSLIRAAGHRAPASRRTVAPVRFATLTVLGDRRRAA